MPLKERIKIGSPSALEILLADGEPKDFYILIKGAGRDYKSTKILSMDAENTFRCYSEVDEMEEAYPTMEAMLEDSNIGLAIKKGVFFYETEAAKAA